jgi:hypothetical protein
MLVVESRRSELRRWILSLALLSFVGLWFVGATHLHLKDVDESNCQVCAAVAHHPAGGQMPVIALPPPASSDSACSDPAPALVHRVCSTPSSRAPPLR